jgi:hypothetical protein
MVTSLVSAAIGSALKMTPAQRVLVSTAASQYLLPVVSKKEGCDYDNNTVFAITSKERKDRASPTSDGELPKALAASIVVTEWDDWDEKGEDCAAVTATAAPTASTPAAIIPTAIPTPATASSNTTDDKAAEDEWDDWDEEDEEEDAEVCEVATGAAVASSALSTASAASAVPSVATPCQQLQRQGGAHAATAMSTVTTEVRCLKCSEKVVGMLNRRWVEGACVDYFYVRTHYPNCMVMAEKTVPTHDCTAAFACQCSWHSVATPISVGSDAADVDGVLLARSCESWYLPTSRRATEQREQAR